MRCRLCTRRSRHSLRRWERRTWLLSSCRSKWLVSRVTRRRLRCSRMRPCAGARRRWGICRSESARRSPSCSERSSNWCSSWQIRTRSDALRCRRHRTRRREWHTSAEWRRRIEGSLSRRWVRCRRRWRTCGEELMQRTRIRICSRRSWGSCRISTGRRWLRGTSWSRQRST